VYDNCFWDVDTSQLDWNKHRNFIISRILEYGTIEQIKELEKNYTREDIASVVKNSNNISKRVAVFWAIILEIPFEEIRACSQPNLSHIKPSKR